MISSYLILAFCSFLLGILSVIIFQFWQREKSYSNRLISVTIFCLAYFTLIVGMVDSGLIIEFPHFFRTASPLLYLAGPTTFLYVRSVLNEENRLLRKEWLHFLPAALHFLELVPFYLLSATEKRSILQCQLVDSDNTLPLTEGVLPPFMHLFFQIGLGLCYFSLQFRLIWIFHRENAPLDEYQRTVFYWLGWLTVMLLLCFGINGIAILFDSPAKTVHHLSTCILGLTLLGIVLYLLFKPQVLYGMTHFTKAPNLFEDIRSRNSSLFQLRSEQIDLYKREIEVYLGTNRSYLNPDFRMRDMVEDTGIPRHHLSAVINRVYQMNFNQLINTYRIDYLKKNFDNPEWSNLTLEGIGKEAGFKSRSSFLNAFKKNTGMTPSEFRKKIS